MNSYDSGRSMSTSPSNRTRTAKCAKLRETQNARALTTNPTAFDALYRSCRPWVLARCRARLSVADAEDACEEIFTKTWRYLRDGRTIDHPTAWLTVVTRHQIIETRRRANRILPVDPQAEAVEVRDTAPGPAELTTAGGITAIVQNWLAELHPVARAAVAGRMSAEDQTTTSRRLGCDVAALRASLYRARQRLRDRLSSDELAP